MAETENAVLDVEEAKETREAGAGDAARSGHLAKELNQEGGLQKDTVSDNGKKKTKEDKPPSKVVIRRLPPTMSKEVFTKEIGPIPEHDYFYFVPGDPYAGSNMGFSRAYINFIHQEDIFSFTETYDNYVFVDIKGQEYPAIVEFALFQRIPKQRIKKKDHLCGSIQSDTTYLAFKENLEAAAIAKPDVTSKQHFFETDVSTNSPQEATTTPLLEFLKQKRVDKARMRDERREEKKRKDNERKLRLKGKEKKTEAEDEPKDIKLLQPKERKDGGGREPRNGRRNERENRAKENRPREFKNRNKNHPTEEKVRIEKRKEEGVDKKEVGDKSKDDGKIKAKTGDDKKEEGAEESGRTDKKRNSRGEGKTGEGSKRIQEGGGNRGKERRSTEGDEKIGDEGRKGRNERNKSVRKERERRRRENYFVKKGLEKRNSGENVDDKKKAKTFRNSANGGDDRQQNKNTVESEEPSKSDSMPANNRNDDTKCESETPFLKPSSECTDRTEDVSFTHKRRGSLEMNFDCKEFYNQRKQTKPKRRNSLESGRIAEETESFKGKSSSGREQHSLSREMSYEDKRGAESDDGCDKSSRLTQEDKASKSDQDDKEKDPRTGRRIRNKDRPSMQIYRPGMGKFSKHRLEKEKTLGSSTEVDSPSHSPSPGPKLKPPPSLPLS